MQKILVVAAPKKFEDHIKIIQDNAIKSWGLLFGDENILLFGDEETKENAMRLGTKYAKPEYSDTNVPLLNSILKTARAFNPDYILFINADIILMNDFRRTFLFLKKICKKPFMMVGRRTNLDIVESINFNSEWQKNIHSWADKNGVLANEESIDYFLFPGDHLIGIPALRVGRPGIDNILLYYARKTEKLDLIDVTHDVQVVHENHDYSYFPGGKPAIYSGKDRDINFELGGGDYCYYYTISECNRSLENGILRRRVHGISYYTSKRYLFYKLPVLHPKFRFMTPLLFFLSRTKQRLLKFRKTLKP